MRRLVKWTIALSLFWVSGCGHHSPAAKVNAYYDVQGTFEQQHQLLTSARFRKKAYINGQSEEKNIQLDSLQWAKELAMFYTSDLNKAALVGGYNEQQTLSDHGRAIIYTKKAETSSPVQWIKLEEDTNGYIRSFSALFSEQNLLYHNQRTLRAEFKVENGHSLVWNYNIKGFQKILLRDTVNYAIESVRLN